jgi:RimJ/RimL family protein N-acetyltransferase
MIDNATPTGSACGVEGRELVLPDGGRVVVQPLGRGDSTPVCQVFAGLGERSRRARFGAPKPRLSARELEALSDVDHDSREALVALDADTGRAVAIVRFVRDRVNRGVAEVAFAVVDAWQARGLGARLAELLACRAREVGVERISASIQSDNVASQSLVRRMGRIVGRSYDGGWVELVAALD